MTCFFIVFDSSNYRETIKYFLDKNPSNKKYLYSFVEADEYQDLDIDVISEYENISDVLPEVNSIVFLSKYKPDLNDEFLVRIFSAGIKNIIWMNERLQVLPLNYSNESNVLFVFPGPILPLNLGSHQRAFNLLSNLNKIGYKIDLLIPKAKNQSEEKNIASSLKLVVNNIYFYKNRKNKHKKIDKVKRKTEQIVRKTIGKNSKLQDTFSERCYAKVSESAKRILNSLYLSKKYPIIIVSYAWMMDIIDLAHPLIDQNTRVICDTHDVQFERSKGYLNRIERLFYSARYEKEMEIQRLNKADVVLAISESDYQALVKEELQCKVLKSSAGFDYQMRPVKRRGDGRPINFGFIGGAMDANLKALKFIFEKWWPSIKKISPESKFYIAGSISNNEVVKEYSFFDLNVVALGFVDDLDKFYNLIDVSLNPVLVQGGLNFKSVEAVFAGKHLFTNVLGGVCLGKDFPRLEIKSSVDLEEFFKRYEFNHDYDLTVRRSNQAKAVKLFSNNSVIKDFENYLKEVLS